MGAAGGLGVQRSRATGVERALRWGSGPRGLAVRFAAEIGGGTRDGRVNVDLKRYVRGNVGKKTLWN